MKPIHPILVLSLSALAFSSAVAAPPSSAGTPAAPAADTSPAQRQKAYMERFDANGDGALDESEKTAMREALGGGAGGMNSAGREEMRARALERFDANGDGTLDEAERGKARAAMREEMGRAAMRFDADGDGELSEDERAAAREAWEGRGGEGRRGGQFLRDLTPEQRAKLREYARKYDADGDGRLSPEERAKAVEAWQASRTPPAGD